MNPLVIIAGPTAIGKTAVSIELAKKINGSVISADSAQVYKGMDIGTAKIKPEEMSGIRHYLIDILDPSEDFNIVTFKSLAKSAADEIRSMQKIPIVVGGTGFYIQSLLYDIDFSKADEMTEYRKELELLVKEKGAGYVHDMLMKVDPAAAKTIHENDTRRVIRALEYNAQTGGLISDHNRQCRDKTSPYDFCYFVITDDREAIYERIDRRVDEMIDAGLVNEVARLKEKGLGINNVSMHALGYKEILSYLEGNCTLEDAIYTIKRDSRHFAKRQLTWFKRARDVIWIDRREEKDIALRMEKELISRGII